MKNTMVNQTCAVREDKAVSIKHLTIAQNKSLVRLYLVTLTKGVNLHNRVVTVLLYCAEAVQERI